MLARAYQIAPVHLDACSPAQLDAMRLLLVIQSHRNDDER